MISTSIDGPRDIHNTCRILRNGKGTYDIVKEKLDDTVNSLGKHNVSALMTTHSKNISRLDEVVDEYIRLGVGSIFIRTINPFGFAANNWREVGYSLYQFSEEYIKTLKYIFDLNRGGIHFPEAYSTLLLTRILTPFSTGFVDLQSPTAAGIGGVVYDSNGDIYVSDEARMLARMNGDYRFRLGNVLYDTWKNTLCGENLKQIVMEGCLESIPGCAWCAFLPYCGVDPVINYWIKKNYGTFGKDGMCCVHRRIFNYLFELIYANDSEIADIMWSWITGRTVEEIREEV
jgi:sulfatase maturation enzyme AslB (radical SAM superfamily)